MLDGNGSVIGHGADVGRMEGVVKIHGLDGPPLHIPGLAFSLANCKNIAVDPLEGSVKMPGYSGRKKKRKHFYRYHVLKIDGSYSGKATEPGDGHADRAMHICRGHFAKYTEGKPLFGKYAGLFWVPMHVRGSVRNGVVDKDYELDPKA
jgi:hypothetical protein